MNPTEERAHMLLVATSYFEDLGLSTLAAHARLVARDALDLTAQLDAERSARIAIQDRATRLERILLARGSTEAA